MSFFKRRKYRPTGTLFGQPSALDEVLEDPLSVPPGTGPYAINAGDAGAEGAVRQDISRDMAFLEDEEAASEERLFDFFKEVGDEKRKGLGRDSQVPTEGNDAGS